MNRVLFVDDEQAVLDGVQNLLRRHRKRWEVCFSLGARSALEAMAIAPFDLVITDMRMPGMDGAELLQEIKKAWPTTMRVVLSGHAEPEALVRASTVAHQFLSKPCDAETLQGVIERAFAVRAFVTEGAAGLEVPIAALDGALEASEAAESVRAMLEVLEAPTIEAASASWGAQALKAAVLHAQLFAASWKHPDVSSLSATSRRAARLARRFFSPGDEASDAFAACLLADVGELVSAELTGAPAPMPLAASLAVSWGLSMRVVEAIVYRRLPAGPRHGHPIVAAVHVADALVSGREPDAELCTRLGLIGQLPEWKRLAAGGLSAGGRS